MSASNSGASNSGAATSSAAKKGLLLLASLLMVVGIVEGGLRVFFAFRVGPSVLLYGTAHQRQQVVASRRPLGGNSKGELTKAARKQQDRKTHNVKYHENRQAGYSKYFPNQKRADKDKDTGEVFPVTINSRGFRGAEIQDAKARGGVRVVALGASSTFGYHDRDDETWPVYLEAELERGCPSRDFEVVNLGIPHQTARNILAILREEALRLDPDVAVFYEGANDASAVKDRVIEATSTPIGRLLKGPSKWSLAAALIDSLVHERTRFDTLSALSAALPEARAEFTASLEALRQASEAHGVQLIVASQQTSSRSSPEDPIRQSRYLEEVAVVRREVEERQSMSSNELKLLAHAELMEAQRDWVERSGAGYVDILAALDHDREVLISFVHLSPRGNQLIAAALAPEILRRTCASD